jgi:diguanylate cyclase
MRKNPSGHSMFEYPQTPAQANEHLRLTLAFLGKHGFSPNPINFTLVYEYLLNRDPALRHAVDQALAQGPIPHEMAIELYRQYILDNDNRRLEEIRNEMRSLIVETLAGVNQASHDVEQSASSLTVSSNRLNQESSVEELRSIVSEVVNETRNIAQNSSSLKQILDETRHEIDNLREELDRTRQQATTDTLTGLLNRRGFEAALQLACNEASQYRQALTLLLIDIDYFKRVNDTYGHLAGDKVLRNVGTILSANVKGKDTVVRFGGEEFAVLLPGTNLDNGRQVGEILRLNIERSRHKGAVAGQDVGQVTVSIGATEYVFGEHSDALLKRADDALYQAKRAGRNRVSHIPPPAQT